MGQIKNIKLHIVTDIKIIITIVMHGEHLAQLATRMMEPEDRKSVSLEDVTIAKSFLSSITDTKTMIANLADMSAAIRFLRNACIDCKRNQDLIVQSDIIKPI